MQDNIKRTAISISILGESTVGKTCICSVFLGLEFREEHLTTIGIEKLSSSIVIDTGEEIKLKIWDTAGQERFKSVSVKNLRYSQAAIVVFDLTSQESFDKVTEWLKEIRDSAPKIPVGLFGNKADLVEQRKIKQEDIDNLCTSEDLEYFETSAKKNTGIKEGFCKISSMAYKMFKDEPNKGIKLNNKKKKKNGKCCTKK